MEEIVKISEDNIRKVQIVGWRTPQGCIIISKHSKTVVGAENEYNDWPNKIQIGSLLLILARIDDSNDYPDKQGNSCELADYICRLCT